MGWGGLEGHQQPVGRELVWLVEPCKLSSAPGKMKSEESVSGGEKVQREAGDSSEPMDSESEMMDKEKESVTLIGRFP